MYTLFGPAHLAYYTLLFVSIYNYGILCVFPVWQQAGLTGSNQPMVNPQAYIECWCRRLLSNQLCHWDHVSFGNNLVWIVLTLVRHVWSVLRTWFILAHVCLLIHAICTVLDTIALHPIVHARFFRWATDWNCWTNILAGNQRTDRYTFREELAYGTLYEILWILLFCSFCF